MGFITEFTAFTAPTHALADASPFTLLALIMHDGPLNLDKELRLSDLLLLFHTHKD